MNRDEKSDFVEPTETRSDYLKPSLRTQAPLEPIKKIVRMETDQTLEHYEEDYEEYHPESEPLKSHPKIST
jgi:hypothetical protein